MNTCTKCKTQLARGYNWYDSYFKHKINRCIDCAKKSSKDFRDADPLMQVLRVIRSRSKKLGLEFDLDRDKIVIPERCPLLGIELSYFEGPTSCSPSIDRKDPTKGYTMDNIWVISNKANIMKSNASYEEFQLMAKNWKEIQEKCNQTIDMFDEAT